MCRRLLINVPTGENKYLGENFHGHRRERFMIEIIR